MLAGIVAFLGTAFGRWLAGGALALLVVAFAYGDGRHDGRVKAEAACASAMAAERLAAAKALEAERSRQAAALAAATEAASTRAAEAEAAATALQQQVDDLTEDVRRRPPAEVCTIGDSDAKKLNAIR